MRKFILLLTAAAAGATGAAARADFSGARRSINGTGETLPAGEGEIGLASVAYGLNADWQLTLPAAAALVGYGALSIKRRWALGDGQRVAPYAGLETPRHVQAGVDYGWDLGSARQHSVAVGGRLRYGPLGRRGLAGKVRALVLPRAEYDYYWRGNVSYAGMSDYVLYLGHTWAFASWHIGLTLSPATGFLPLPYAYWRF